MTPIFNITADSKDVTFEVAERLLSLTITDEAGIKSDTAELVLDDRDSIIALPAKGAVLSIRIGYKEQGTALMGLYTVDEVTIKSPPQTITISAKAADMRKTLKSHKTQSWDNINLGDIVATLADRNGLNPAIDRLMRPIKISHIDQTNESDLNLLTRLAKQYGAIAKPAGGFLVFAKQDNAKSLTGKSLARLEISPEKVRGYQVSLADRGRYKAVKAIYHDAASGDDVPVVVGTGEPVYTLRHQYPNSAEAKAAAEAKYKAFSRGTATVNLTLSTGNPAAAAEGTMILDGFRRGVNGIYVITNATHTLNNEGYNTRIKAEIKKNNG